MIWNNEKRKRVTYGGKETELIYANATNIKVGDKVIVQNSRDIYMVDEITKITPTKCFRTKYGEYFNADGHDKQSDGWRFTSVFLYDEKFAEIIHNERFRRNVLGDLNDLKDITYEQACQVNEILGLMEE